MLDAVKKPQFRFITASIHNRKVMFSVCLSVNGGVPPSPVLGGGGVNQSIKD